MRTRLLYAAAVLSATAIVTTSCEKTLPNDVNDSRITALTVNLAAEYGKPVTATLTLSNTYSRLLDPTYNLSADTKYRQRLIIYGTMQLTVNGSATYPMTYNESGQNYVSDYIPSEEDVISVEAKSSVAAATARATCTVPNRPEISLVDYSIGYNDTDSLDADIRVRITDPEGKNYYRIIVRTTARKTTENDPVTSSTGDGSDVTQYYTDDTFTSDDEVFHDTSIYKGYGSWPAFFSNVFDDKLFEGSTRDIALHVSRDCDGMECTGMEVRVQSLSKDMYLYMKSYMQYRLRSNYDDGSGSFYIYTNVDNGYGIVGGVATGSVDIPLN